MRREKARNITGTRPEVIGNKRRRESGAGEEVSDSFIAPIAMRTIRRWSSSNAVSLLLLLLHPSSYVTDYLLHDCMTRGITASSFFFT